MKFAVVVRGGISDVGKFDAYLEIDKWNDWFEYITMFHLSVVDKAGTLRDIGNVKIGQFGMNSKQNSPEFSDKFEKLGDNSFSLGQDDSYYQNLKELGDEIRISILTNLKDVAFDNNIFISSFSEPVMQRSLLRDISPNTVRGQFSRLAHGGLRLSNYEFDYTSPVSKRSQGDRVAINFTVKPGSLPPTNIHVLIGRNGVGKSYLLNSMVKGLLNGNAEGDKKGYFKFGIEQEDPFTEKMVRTESDSFSSIVSVSFSAFDDFGSLENDSFAETGMRYRYIGLKRDGKIDSIPKTPAELSAEFVESILQCNSGARSKRWKKALRTLEADPIFKDSRISDLADEGLRDESGKDNGLKIFKRLSSGHKIVLLTVSRLVESVVEKTLVLMDEPESHLHPPLLSAFIRALSDLLVDRNGVGIVATHSPVILQEVPKSCVWKILRSGYVSKAERPEIETFGENVGILTREVFGLEVTHSGFHKMLSDSVVANSDYAAIVREFNGKLGGEAKAIVQALIAARSKKEDY